MRLDLWDALSDIFVDNEVSYEFIARRIKNYPVADIKRSLFYDVAPICAPNLTVLGIPPIWTGFVIEQIAPLIQAHLIRYDSSHLYRFKIECLVTYYEFKFKSDWEMLRHALEQAKIKQSVSQ